MPTALITGANRGIGLEFVKQLTQRGWKVYGTVRNVESMPPIEGVKVFKLESDSLVDPHLVAGQLLALDVKFDAIIANAGIDPSPARLIDLPPAVFQEAFQVNVHAPLILFQALRPLLKDQGRFAILGSLAGNFSLPLGPGCGAYDFSKIGVNFLVRKLQAEHPELRILALNPGPLITDMGIVGTAWRHGDLSTRLQPHETVPGMIQVLQSDKEDYRGRLVDWDGTVLDF